MNKLVKLREVAEIVISNVDKKYNSDEKEITLCNYTDVYKNWAITLENSKSFMLATAKEKEIEKFILRKGQVAITKDSEKKDDIGISAYISKNFNDTLLGYHCALITPNTEYLNGKFLNVFLHSKLAKKYFENQASGSGQRYSLSLESLNSLKIPLFNIGIQKKIGELYSNIDKKIELNNKINSELEVMAKTIYDYWFLQFEFPNEEGKPYKSSGGKMVWNEELKREIPEGWGITTIENIIVCHDSKRIPLSKKEREEMKGNIPYYGATGIVGYVNKPIFNGDYVLIAEDGSIMDEKGKPIIQRVEGEIWVNNHAHILEPKDNYSCKLLMLVLKDISVVQIKTGSIQMKINQQNLNRVKILDIPKEIKKKVNTYLNIIDRKILDNKKENQELISLRDFLLPLLMNGQVGFKEEN